MKEATVGVHHHVDHAVFFAELVNVDDGGVVVRVEQEELIVGRYVQHTRIGVGHRVSKVKLVGRERNERVGWSKHFNDHLGQLGVRWKIPSGARVAVGVQSTVVGCAGRERTGLAQHAQPSPVKQGRPHAVNDKVRFFDGRAVLPAGADFERDVGQFGARSESQLPISGGALTCFRHGSDGIQRDPAGVVTSFQWPRHAARFSVR